MHIQERWKSACERQVFWGKMTTNHCRHTDGHWPVLRVIFGKMTTNDVDKLTDIWPVWRTFDRFYESSWERWLQITVYTRTDIWPVLQVILGEMTTNHCRVKLRPAVNKLETYVTWWDGWWMVKSSVIYQSFLLLNEHGKRHWLHVSL